MVLVHPVKFLGADAPGPSGGSAELRRASDKNPVHSQETCPTWSMTAYTGRSRNGKRLQTRLQHGMFV